MTKEEAINFLIYEDKKDRKIDTHKIRDGYHSFGELYDHRITLFILLCKIIYYKTDHLLIWKSKFHSDKSSFDGWFIMGINTKRGEQITYHLPNEKWELCYFAKTLSRAPEWDGHTSEDVLDRLQLLDFKFE